LIPFLKPKVPEMQLARDELDQAFGHRSAELKGVFAPYRIRPLGAHLDHQGGPVFSMNTAFGIHGVWRLNQTREVRVLSQGIGRVVIPVDQSIQRLNDGFDYLRATLSQVLARGVNLPGVDVYLQGELTACGLSSSAAVTLLYQEILLQETRLALSIEERLDWAVACENHFIGVQSGIGDQTSILYGKESEAVLYDCRQRWATNICEQSPWTFLVLNSGQSAALSGSTSFNDRVAESYAAAEELGRLSNDLSDQPKLSDYSEPSFRKHCAGMTSISQRRGEHFFTEIERVRLGVEAWKADDKRLFGQLMNASCQSSVLNYETGTPALIELVGLLQSQRGVLGARFSGAGTRGCVVALIEPGEVRPILEALPSRYSEELASLMSRQWAFTTQAHRGLSLL